MACRIALSWSPSFAAASGTVIVYRASASAGSSVPDCTRFRPIRSQSKCQIGFAKTARVTTARPGTAFVSSSGFSAPYTSAVSSFSLTRGSLTAERARSTNRSISPLGAGNSISSPLRSS